MLKTRVDDQIWLVHQPDHARVSGYLAAHWGNANDFARPGEFAASADPELLRQEVIHAIAEHDNGWWEWEAAPDLDTTDSLPLNLPDVTRANRDAGLNRWRLGVPRLADRHPYVSLLISMHAYWLYAFAYPDLHGDNDALRHPIFGIGELANRLVADRNETHTFLTEQREFQDAMIARLREDGLWSDAVRPPHLQPHIRLLQLLDALSLLMSFGGQSDHTFLDVPRRNWDDRVTVAWTVAGQRRIVCDPYPFDEDPLPVYLPVRMVADESATTPEQSLPLVRLHASPLTTIRFELSSQARP